jgi:hypothetical protein
VTAMTLDKIVTHFGTQGQECRICTDVRLAPGFPGYVRSVYLGHDCLIVVEFEQYGFDEAGAYFYGRYPDYASAVVALEAYLSTPLGEWMTGDCYPSAPDQADTAEGTRKLASAITSRTVPLPALPGGAIYELRGSSGWL